MTARQLRTVFLGVAALLLMLALASPAHAAITATITHIDGNADNQAFPPYFRYVNDGNLTIDFNVTDANYADLYYSKSRKAFTNLIFDDLNLSALKASVSSLKGYWRFDNNSLIDYSGNGNTPMNVNATYIPVGKFGGAFGFTPEDQNGIQAGDSSSLDISGGLFARTIVMAWVFVPAGTAYNAADFNKIAYKGGNYLLDLNGGSPRFYVSGGGGTYTCSVTATGPLVTGRWHHISGEYYNTGGEVYNKATIYVDGDANNYSDVGTCANGPVGLGTNDLNFVVGENFNGNIDEVAVFAQANANESSAYEDSNNMRYNVCQDLNFTNSTWCRWDFDESAVADGNYFIDINVFSTVDTNATDASDNNFQLWQNPALDVNILALDGFSDANVSNIFSYYADKNITIDFNVSCMSTHAPKVDLWYSAVSGGQENSIMSDIDLLAAGVCADTNFLDSTKCSYDFNISKTLVLDGNYFIDINFRDDIFGDTNSTDYNFQIDNNAPVPNADYNAFWAANDQNVKLYCSIDANWKIAATNDDCFITGTNTKVCNLLQAWGDLKSLGAAYVDTNGYYRWALDIPPNSKIFSAQMDEQANSDCGTTYASYCSSTGYIIKIELMNSTNQSAFNSGSPWGVATAASVDYSLTSAWTANTWYSTPDLNSLVQAFVNMSGYASGNYIGIRYSHNNVADSTGKIANSFNSGSAPAKLFATYGADTGVKDCANILYRLDTDDTNTVNFGAWQSYNSAAGLPITSDGNWALDINVTDRARNISDTNRVYILIDKAISITSPQQGQVLSNPNVTFSYSASSKLGAVNAYWVKLDDAQLFTNNGTSTTYSTTITSGAHTLYVMANASGDVNSPAASVSFTINLGAGTAVCGDGTCDPNIGETACSCSADCTSPVCGDGCCSGTETPETCTADCMVGCGDNICDPDVGEACGTCASDCGECAPGEEQLPEEETVLEQTQTGQATIQQIEDVLRDVGFTISEIEAAKDAGTKLSIARTITVEKKTADEGVSESYESRITLAVTNTTSSALKNVRIVEVVPKSVANTADEVTSARPFAVLKSDPVLQFSLSEIAAGGTSEVRYTIAKRLTEEQIASYLPPIPAYAIEAAEATCANVKCNDKNPCTDDLCFDGECAYVYAKDGTTCGFGEECMQGICRSLAFARPVAGGVGLDMMTITAIVVVVAAFAIGAAAYIRRH